MAGQSICPTASWVVLEWNNTSTSSVLWDCTCVGVPRSLFQVPCSLDSENIHGRGWKICGSCLKKEAVRTMGFKAHTELCTPAAAGVIVKLRGYEAGHEKYQLQSPCNTQSDMYLTWSLIHCWALNIYIFYIAKLCSMQLTVHCSRQAWKHQKTAQWILPTPEAFLCPHCTEAALPSHYNWDQLSLSIVAIVFACWSVSWVSMVNKQWS